MKFACNFCKKEFVKETSIAVHMCEPKRRRMEKDERGVQLGFQAYIKFYETMQGSAKLKTFEHFADSAYYKAFVKFGRYCHAIHAVNISRFIEWLLKNNKKIDFWCKDSVYTEYLADYLRLENVNDALARAIEQSIKWAEETNNPAHDYLRYANSNAVCYAITNGKISPWILYNSESGQQFLSDLNQEQIAIIWSIIDADFWHRKFQDYPADKEYVREILTRAGW